MRARGSARRLVLLAIALGAFACHGVPLFAPTGSSLGLTANPGFIPINGGVSAITAFLTRPDGVPVSDGTVIQCFTNLGSVDFEIKTSVGVAHTNLVADSRSGMATVTSSSGGPSSVPSTASPSPSSSPTQTVSPSPTTTGGGTSGAASATTTVTIGNPNAVSVKLVSQSNKIGQGRPSTLVATVFDVNGNFVQNVPVIFSILSPSGLEEVASGGTPQFTDNNGQAFDLLFTKDSRDDNERTIEVQALVPVSSSGTPTGDVFVVVN